MPDLLVRDDREPGRWGPRGTHVSQSPIASSHHHIILPVYVCKVDVDRDLFNVKRLWHAEYYV
jgi:hypothetical protein